MEQESLRENFVRRIALAIFRGRARAGRPVPETEARERAEQIADALPGLFSCETIQTESW